MGNVDIRGAMRDYILQDLAIDAAFARWQFTTGVDKAAIFTNQDIIPKACHHPAGIITVVGGVHEGTYADKGQELMVDIRVYGDKGRSDESLHALAVNIWLRIHRARVDYDPTWNIGCFADPPQSLSDEDGFPGYLISCRVILIFC